MESIIFKTKSVVYETVHGEFGYKVIDDGDLGVSLMRQKLRDGRVSWGSSGLTYVWDGESFVHILTYPTMADVGDLAAAASIIEAQTEVLPTT